jgi:hypothetical protein
MTLDPQVGNLANWRREVHARRIKFDDQAKHIYVQELAKHGLRRAAALAANVDPNTVLTHLKTDPDFYDAVEAALSTRQRSVVETLETEALLGHEEVIITGEGENKRIVKRKVVESNLRLAMLKKYDPEGYNQKTEEANAGNGGGGGVILLPRRLTMEEWFALYAPKEEPENVEPALTAGAQQLQEKDDEL